VVEVFIDGDDDDFEINKWLVNETFSQPEGEQKSSEARSPYFKTVRF